MGFVLGLPGLQSLKDKHAAEEGVLLEPWREGPDRITGWGEGLATHEPGCIQKGGERDTRKVLEASGKS